MPTPPQFDPREADQRTAPFAIAYLAAVVAWIAAALAIIFWIRG